MLSPRFPPRDSASFTQRVTTDGLLLPRSPGDRRSALRVRRVLALELLPDRLDDESLDRHVRINAVVGQRAIYVVLQKEADPLALPPLCGGNRSRCARGRWRACPWPLPIPSCAVDAIPRAYSGLAAGPCKFYSFPETASLKKATSNRRKSLDPQPRSRADRLARRLLSRPSVSTKGGSP